MTKGRDPGVPMRRRAMAQRQCDEWNQLYPVGMEVIVTDYLGKEHLTKTRSMASVGSGRAEIWTEYVLQYYALDRIRPRKCRICGCTTFHACKPRAKACPFLSEVLRTWPGCFEDCPDTEQCPNVGCHWVEKDLCSACVNPEATHAKA